MQGTQNKILIITTSSFPLGLAGTSRISAYGKGFLYHGYQPEVICIRPTDPYNSIVKNEITGTFEGILYYYPGMTNVRVKSFLGRRINDLSAYFQSVKRLFFLLKKNEVLFAVFYGVSVIPELTFIFLMRLFGKEIFKEESENPHIYFKGGKNPVNKFFEWFYIKKLYKLYNGILVMTNPLKEFFIATGVIEKKILHVTQTVDRERFEKGIHNYTMPLTGNYIAYVGSLNQQKDGVITLLFAYKKVSDVYPEIDLIIAGEGTQQEKNELSSHINKLKLNERVKYLGRISSIEIPAFLNGAKILLSCRPKSLQSDFGFPTKVVEYLATGKPVVTTINGELAIYLKDRVNVFVADNADANSVSSKILEVLQDYDFAMKVAQNGKELAREKFNPIIQTKKIIDFCKECNVQQ